MVLEFKHLVIEFAATGNYCQGFLGGYGTVEEVLEMLTWSQLGIHKEPIGLLNVDGYYNSLLALFDNGVEEGIIKPSDRHIILFTSTAK
ncbi:hypothetical protein RHGRI_005441 [Rhododendron griersonianum]|uniref:cytokinin riboside 5'-monophosphate phosphoribohydrolase n=1 Tax=Rhododendron griersonianum TaxID=479676 RepID=A0AAV6LD31_9ERIC|nr:hypothetical protein RHGRI_005441 [Rhododendron griersonianum]